MAKSSKPRPSSLEARLKNLQMRVSFLERALRPAKQKASQPDDLERSRKRAEEMARYAALADYYRQRKIEYYLRNPSVVAADLAQEREIADFLRSRGLTPEPSRIPEQFHRGLKGYRPKDNS